MTAQKKNKSPASGRQWGKVPAAAFSKLQKDREVLLEGEVTEGQLLTLVCLATFADSSGHCFPRQELIAERRGRPLRTVRRHLARLEEVGLIRREHKNGQWRTDYWILPQAAPKLPPTTPPQPRPVQMAEVTDEDPGHKEWPGLTPSTPDTVNTNPGHKEWPLNPGHLNARASDQSKGTETAVSRGAAAGASSAPEPEHDPETAEATAALKSRGVSGDMPARLVAEKGAKQVLRAIAAADSRKASSKGPGYYVTAVREGWEDSTPGDREPEPYFVDPREVGWTREWEETPEQWVEAQSYLAIQRNPWRDWIAAGGEDGERLQRLLYYRSRLHNVAIQPKTGNWFLDSKLFPEVPEVWPLPESPPFVPAPRPSKPAPGPAARAKTEREAIREFNSLPAGEAWEAYVQAVVGDELGPRSERAERRAERDKAARVYAATGETMLPPGGGGEAG